MKHKKIIQVMVLISLIILIVGCTQKVDVASKINKKVRIVTAEKELAETGLSYLGVVSPKDTKKYSFLTGGKIQSFYVKEGDFVKKGDYLTCLDVSSLKYSEQISNSNAKIAEITENKTRETYATKIKITETTIQNLEHSIQAAKEGLDVFKSNLDASKNLYENDIIAKKQLEAQNAEYLAKEAEYKNLLGNYDSAQNNLQNLKESMEKDLNIAQANAEIARTSVSQLVTNIEDATIYSDINGYVMEISYEEGEFVGGGQPVVIIKGEKEIVTIGVSIQDYKKINKDTKVKINNTISGKINSIAQYPDENTRNYAVDIEIQSDVSLPLGETVEVLLVTGTENMFYLPIESVFSVNGLDYVYVVNSEKKVAKQEVKLENVKGNKLSINGLKEGSKVVANGIKKISENDYVDIVEQEQLK